MNVNDHADTTKRQVRGSSLLLGGRVLSMAVKVLTQTLVVRALATSDYGTWAYALSAVTLLLGFAHLSFDQSVARFASMYREHKRYNELFGMLVLAGVTVLASSVVLTAPVLLAPSYVSRAIGGNAAVLGILSVLILLVPVGALDRLLVATFATFGRTRTIFLRRYLVAPALQLAVVLLLVVRHASVTFLTYGYVLSEVIGLALYGGLLVRLFREEKLLAHFSFRSIKVPLGEVFAFSFPLATSDWLTAFIQSSGVLVLGYVYSTRDVALFRAVLPVAVLNSAVLESFTVLFLPAASRLFARRDFDGVNQFYWRTTVWISVLSFPVFAATFALATPLAVLLFGARYAASGQLLAILSLGFYLQAALGFNGSTLKVAGMVRFLVMINLAALGLNAALILLLVPRYGAAGAAWALTATLAVHNVLKQAGLRRVAGFRPVDGRFVPPLAVVTAGVIALAVVRWVAPYSLFVLVPTVACIALAVVSLTKRSLQIGEVFPELRKLPILRPLLT